MNKIDAAVSEAGNYADGVAAAYQLGRLDFITAILAAVALILAIGVAPLFIYVKGRTKKVATKAVNRRMRKLEPKLEATVVSKMEAMIPTLFHEYMRLRETEAGTPAEEADQIADAQENEIKS